MNIVIQLDETRYRLATEAGDEGPIVDYGEQATLTTSVGKYLAMIDDPDEEASFKVFQIIPKPGENPRLDPVPFTSEDVEFDDEEEEEEEETSTEEEETDGDPDSDDGEDDDGEDDGEEPAKGDDD